MRKSYTTLVYILLVVVQILLCNYFHVTPYITLSILPIMILCLPLKISTVAAMIIAFVTGLSVDFLAEGLIGINALALVPVAYVRKSLIGFVFGEDLISRGEDFSIRKNGLGEVSMAILLVQSLFLIIYIAADGAGTRPFWFNAARFGASLAAGYLVALLLVDTLVPDSRK
ncbi:MAG: hypothetical protein II761_02005 [Bacteroidales bacterium]|jgi:rod shape-determining protein MreD|nr:hypothetical protein [Bacteroidales bacterium]MBQ3846314.1 hypothetical protein [Bacteroidales bacterium]